MANSFVLALFQIATEEGNTQSIELLRNAAFQKLQTGETKSLVTSSLNSKSFSYNVSKPADELFAEASQAIRLYNSGTLTATQFDWTLM